MIRFCKGSIPNTLSGIIRGLTLGCVAGLFAGALFAQEPPAGAPADDGPLAPGLQAIRADELRPRVAALTDDALAGRLTNTPGNARAAVMIRDRFAELGLSPAGGRGSYFHPYRLMTVQLGSPEDNWMDLQTAGGQRRARFGVDLFPQRFSATARAAGPVTFAGFGIVAPELGRDDYDGLNVEGRVVLVLDHEPGEDDPDSPLDGLVQVEAGTPLRKTLAAQQHGAVAVLFVTDVHNHPGAAGIPAAAAAAWPSRPSRTGRYLLASWAERVKIPVVEVSRTLASRLVSSSGFSLEALARSSEAASGGPGRELPGAWVEVSAAVVRNDVPDRNVLAVLEGADPVLRNEWVLIGAHLDHDGSAGSVIYTGADDNVSGVVGMLRVAAAYAEAARQGVRPRRSLLFAAWNSEERGLLGAWAYADDPLVPLADTVAVLNLDMIGRDEEIPAAGGFRFQGLPAQPAAANTNAVNLLGYSFAPDVSEVVARANRALAEDGLDVRRRYDNTRANMIRRSDQWPFLQYGVPAVWFHTGLHPDYHTPQDLPEKLNYEKMARIVRLVYETSWLLAQDEPRPARPAPAAAVLIP